MSSPESKTITIPFTWRGQVTGKDTGELSDAQFQTASNMTSLLEGSACTRYGRKKLGRMDAGHVTPAPAADQLPLLVHTIAKMRISDTDSQSLRYIGESEDIFRSTDYQFFTKVAVKVDQLDVTPSPEDPVGTGHAGILRRRWSMATYSAGTSGNPWAYFATPLKMLRDSGLAPFASLQKWGILPAAGAAAAELYGAPLDGLPDGGTGDSPAASEPYDYLYCVTPDTPILCGDMAWRPAGDLPAGTEIISFDEHEDYGVGKRCMRRYRKAHIVSNTPSSKKCFELQTDIGDPIKASEEHPWLVYVTNHRVNGKRYGGGLEWKKTSELKPGDRIAHFAKPWEEDGSKDAGWLAGIFDGEGSVCINSRTTKSGCECRSLLLTIAQKPGIVLDRIKRELAERSINYYESAGKGGCHHLSILGIRSIMRLMGTVRPIRLLAKLSEMDFLPGVKQKTTYDLAEVVSIKPIGKTSVATIQTSSGTFITGGYLSHNCYVNGSTGEIGNPSVPMIAALASHLQKIQVTVWGSPDPQVTKIFIYRRGGTYTDGLYRRVGWVANDYTLSGPTLPQIYHFIDNQPDYDLLNALLLEFDNDPPVTSTLPTPVLSTIATTDLGGGGAWAYITLADPYLSTVATAGTSIFIGPPSGSGGTAETVVIYYVGTGGNAGKLWAYFQYAHAANEQVSCNAITAQPAPGTFSAFDSLFVYGDPNNPQNLYKSKAGRPASFPIINSTGAAQVIAVGSPSNGIMAAGEYAGDIISLNVNNIFIVRVWQGVMQNPIATPAQRGLFSRQAWCIGDNTLWYMAYDGIYAWKGGEAQSISEQIAPIFIGQWANNIPPMDLRDTAAAVDDPTIPRHWIKFQYWRKTLYVMYRDVSGDTQVIGYNTMADRWEPAVWGGWDETPIISQPTTLFVEPDNGRFIVARYAAVGAVLSEYGVEPRSAMRPRPPGEDADPSTYTDGIDDVTDEWTTTVIDDVEVLVDGALIDYHLKTGFHHLNMPQIRKVYEEILLEIENPVAVSARVYFDYKGVAATDVWAIPAGPRRMVSLLHGMRNFGSVGVPVLGTTGSEAYAMAFEFYGSTDKRITFFGLSYTFHALGQITSGAVTPWNDLGWQYDKRLYTLWVKYDTGGVDQDILVDLKGGIDGNTLTAGAARFTLTNDVATPSGRTFETSRNLPLPDGLIAKLVRLRPVFSAASVGAAGTPTLKIIDWNIRAENLPEDIVYFTKWDDDGYPYLKYFEQLVLEIDTGGQAVPFKVQGDGADVFTGLTVTATSNDTQRVITLPGNRTYRQARLLVPSNTIPVGGKFQVISAKFIWVPADKGPVTHTYDWDDLGHLYDKRLITCNLEWDNTGGTQIQLQMDILGGIDGNTITTDVQRFTIPADNRSKKTWGLPNNTIAKMVRIHPVNQTMPVTLRAWKYNYTKEDLPPDVVYFSILDYAGTPYLKYFEQIVFDVDTNGKTVPFSIEADGATLITGNTVNTTLNDRVRIITLPGNQTFHFARIIVAPSDIPAAGKFQLYSVKFIAAPADKGPVTHTFDWDDLNHPHDKRLHTVTLEWDLRGASTVTMRMDTLTGIGGATLNTAVATFDLPAARGKKTWGLPDGLIVKMIRISPSVDAVPISFRHWQYTFNKEDFPPDIVYFTEPNDFEYPYEKIARNLILKVDTGGSNATVNLVGDATIRDTFVVNTTLDDWRRMIAVRKDQIAKLWKLAVTPDPAGKFQLFSWDLDHIKEPAYINMWRSYEITLGYTGWKFIKQVWMEYIAPSGLIMTIDSDTGQWIHEFPAHLDRSVERFLLPSVWGYGLNKSKKYIVTFGPAGAATPAGPSMQFGIPIDFVAGQTMTLNIPVRVGYLFSRLDWNISADVGEMPVGSNAVIDVQISKDRGATWASIFPSGGEIVITPAGANYGTVGTFAIAGADVGDWLKAKCLAVGSTTAGKGIQVLMFGGIASPNTGPLFKIYPQSSGLEFVPLGADRRMGYQNLALSEFLVFPI